MRKGLGVLVLVAALVALGASTALAAPATVIMDAGTCYIRTEASGLGIDLWSDDLKNELKILTDSANENVKVTCHFIIPEGYEPAEALVNKGFECGIKVSDAVTVTTYHSLSVASPGGQLTLQCIYKADEVVAPE